MFFSQAVLRVDKYEFGSFSVHTVQNYLTFLVIMLIVSLKFFGNLTTQCRSVTNSDGRTKAPRADNYEMIISITRIIK